MQPAAEKNRFIFPRHRVFIINSIGNNNVVKILFQIIQIFFLITHKSRLFYTLEAPSDFPLSTRVAALVQGVKAAVEKLSSKG